MAALFIAGCDDDEELISDLALSGTSQVPPVATLATGTMSSELDGSTLRINGDFAGLESDLFPVDGSPIHVHRAPIGENGPIVFPVDVISEDLRNGTFSFSRALSTDELADYEAGLYYVNIHSVVNPSGELRAQLSTDNLTPEVFDTSMTGDQEVPAVTTTGTGNVQVANADRTMTLVGSFSNLSSDLVTAATGQAHVHRAPAGQNGPVVIDLVVIPGADSRSGSFRVATVLNDDLFNAFNAGELYVNVHTQAYPNGELRTQLIPATNGETPQAPTPAASPTPQY